MHHNLRQVFQETTILNFILHSFYYEYIHTHWKCSGKLCRMKRLSSGWRTQTIWVIPVCNKVSSCTKQTHVTSIMSFFSFWRSTDILSPLLQVKQPKTIIWQQTKLQTRGLSEFSFEFQVMHKIFMKNIVKTIIYEGLTVHNLYA